MLILTVCASQTARDISHSGSVSARVPQLPQAVPQLIDLPDGGFSLIIQPGFDIDTDAASINLSDPSGELIVSLNGRPYIASIYTLESFLGKYIAEMASRDGSFEQGKPYEIVVDGISGIAMDLNGTFLDLPVAGKVVAVSPGKDFIVFGLGMSNLSKREDGWTESGNPDFEAILRSIKFKDEVKR